MLAMQPRHLLPEWQEVLGVTTPPAAGARELALVDPSPVASGDPGDGEHLLGFDLAGRGRDHLAALRGVALQDVVHRRLLQLPPEPSQPLAEELLRGPRQNALLDERCFPGEWLEHPDGVAEGGCETVGEMPPCLDGPGGEPGEPGPRVIEVVLLLQTDHADQLRQLRPRRLGQPLQTNRVGGVVQVLPRDREPPVPVGALAQDGVSIFGGLPAERQVVLRASRDLVGQCVKQSRVRHLVLGDRAEREVLLDVRRPPGPLRMTMADHELVVGQREQEREPRVVAGHPACSLALPTAGRGASIRSPRSASSCATRFSLPPTPAYASCRRYERSATPPSSDASYVPTWRSSDP